MYKRKNGREIKKVNTKQFFLLTFSIILTSLVFNSCSSENKIEKEPIIKDYVGGEVKIDSQIWMTQNLNVNVFRNGDAIPEAKSEEEWNEAGKNKQPAWCYYDNDPKNGTKYGKLYNWYAVNDSRGLAPAGWHIPTDAEWTTLENQVGDVAGKKMKSISGWSYDGNGTNESGFSGLPGGYRHEFGGFSFIGYGGFWWSATESSADRAYGRGVDHSFPYLDRSHNGKERGGLSVRCLRD